jgi:hypothetical protein
VVISRSVCLVALLLIAGAPAAAQSAQTAPEFWPEGHVISKKTLADCKRQARIRKMSYIRQRHFIRKCVGP